MSFADSMEAQLVGHSRQSLQKSIEVLSENMFDDSTARSNDVALLADCHFKMAQFCYDQLEVEVLGEVSFGTNLYAGCAALPTLLTQYFIAVLILFECTLGVLSITVYRFPCLGEHAIRHKVMHNYYLAEQSFGIMAY